VATLLYLKRRRRSFHKAGAVFHVPRTGGAVQKTTARERIDKREAITLKNVRKLGQHDFLTAPHSYREVLRGTA